MTNIRYGPGFNRNGKSDRKCFSRNSGNRLKAKKKLVPAPPTSIGAKHGALTMKNF